jgi:hypothetical protein
LVSKLKVQDEFGSRATIMARWRHIGWLVILIADVADLAWGAMAALAPGYLLGPGSAPILTAEYESFTGGSWPALAPKTADFVTLLFRMYGIHVVVFGLLATAIYATAFRRGESWAWWALLVGNTIAYGSAMTFDLTVGAIGPFEATEYIALGAVYVTLAVTAPFVRRNNQVDRRPHTLSQ